MLGARLAIVLPGEAALFYPQTLGPVDDCVCERLNVC